MKSKNSLYSYSMQEFVSEIKKRLNILYDVDDTYEISKNKVTFTVNGNDVQIQKDNDKESKKKKIIITHTDMFPYAFYLDNDKFAEKEVIGAVNSIDCFYTELLGLDPVKQSLCSRYNALKWALLPCFVTNFSDEKEITKVQEELLNYLAYEIVNKKDSSNELLIYLSCQDIETDREDKFFLFAAGLDKLTIYLINYDTENNKLLDSEEEIESYDFPYDKYPDQIMLSAVKKLIKKYYNFNIYQAEFNEDIINEVEEENTEE